MIHIKIYNKGRSKTHTYVKAHCPMQQIVAVGLQYILDTEKKR